MVLLLAKSQDGRTLPGETHIGGTPGAMDLTREQAIFLAELRRGTRSATAAQDASMIGPLIRANLVRWDDDPSESVTRRRSRGSTFNLTLLGEVCLGEHDAQEHLPG